jgi:hypothetical protein
MRWTLTTFLALSGAFFSNAPVAEAHDWFVRAGADGGDGSIGKPFSDPWQALEKCEAGDAVRVAAGKYYGRSRLGTWVIPFDKVQLVGGYDRDFKNRNPWRYLTELLWDSSSKNWPKEERVSSQGKGVVVDGIVIDMQDQNEYIDPQRTSRRDKSAESAMRFTQPATVRNSVIINPGEKGISCTGGALIENNLIVNAVGWGIEVKSGMTDPATIRHNTIIFTWTFKEPGKGAYQGSAISLQGPATVAGNILAYGDNNGIYQTAPPDSIGITGNVFFMNLYSNLKFGVDGRETAIDDKSMDMLEDVGLKAHDGNVVKNPELPLDKNWMDQYSQREAALPGKLEMNDWNNLRKTLGLPMIAKGGRQAIGVAPPWKLDLAMALMNAKAAGDAGARVQKLELELSGAVAAASAKSYQPSDLVTWNREPATVDGKALELTVAVGSIANVNGIPAQYPTDEHAGVSLYDKDGKGERITGFFKKGSAVQRTVDRASGYYQGSGKPDRLFVVRGVAHVVNNIPKAGLFIEFIEPTEAGGAASAAAATRPHGRDWFVRAGSSGGDGSSSKPFKDPFQALEKCQTGDTVRVSEGEYYGKLHAGNWQISKPYLALVGGYDKDFKTRNPWKHPTLLRTGADYKGHRTGYTIEGGQEDHTGAIIDGFVFDKKGDNKYTETGDLDYSNSDKNQHIWLARPDCIIRNNVFVNGAEGALRVASGQTVENNIFMNHHMKTVDVQPGFGDAPFVFRNNTAAFAWDIRFGQGRGTNGNLLILGTRTRAIVDHNVFEFADNDAIRLNANAGDVELTRNVFSHNLWSNVQKMDGWVTADDKTWAQLGDFGWKKLEANVVMSAALPIDKKWFDVYLGRTAMVPGKVTMDDWNQLRELLGQPVLATGGKAGTGFAPAYDWHDAIRLFPKNPKVTAGAVAKDLPVD